MSKFISLNDAAQLAQRSTQTIRRLIKANKVNYRRKKTPQGFIYFIDEASLYNLFADEMDEELSEKADVREGNPAPPQSVPDTYYVASRQQHYLPASRGNYPSAAQAPYVHNNGNSEKVLSPALANNANSQMNVQPFPEQKESDYYHLMITQKDEQIGELKQALETAKDNLSRETQKNSDLIRQHFEQVNAVNRLSQLCETMQGRLQLYEQRFLKAAPKWWQFWKKDD